MAHSKFSLDGPAFEGSTRQVIQPDHVMLLQEEEEVMEAGVDTQLIQTSPGLLAPQQAADAPENLLLNSILEAGGDHDRLHAFRDILHYLYGDNPGSDSDVPEDELTDEMEDISSDEEQLVPVSFQEEEGSPEGDYGHQSPGNIPVEDTIAIEENIEPNAVNLHVSLVNVQATEPKDPRSRRNLDEIEDIVAIEEDLLVPVNSQEEEDPTEGDHDQPSRPGNIQLEDIIAIKEDRLIAVKLQVEGDFTVQGDHDLPNPVIIPAEDIIAIEGNETSPMNLHATLVNVQVLIEPEDPSTPRRVDLSTATVDSVYSKADQKVIPENQLNVKVQTVATTSPAEGESSSSNLILMDIHVNPKPPESEDSYELLHEAVNGDSTDLKDVNQTPLKRAIEGGAPEIWEPRRRRGSP